MNEPMEEIETLAKEFAGARTELAERLGVLREEQETAKRRRLQGIKNAVARVADAHAKLREAVGDNKPLFDKPKTRTLHGIRVGFMKQVGKLEISDDGATIAQLRKLLGDEAEAYIQTTEKPVRDALKNLPAATLAKIGASLTDTTDVVVVKAADDGLDKLIGALLNDAELETLT